MIKPGSNYIKTASFNDLIDGTHIFLCLLLVIFFFVNKYLKKFGYPYSNKNV